MLKNQNASLPALALYKDKGGGKGCTRGYHFLELFVLCFAEFFLIPNFSLQRKHGFQLLRSLLLFQWFGINQAQV